MRISEATMKTGFNAAARKRPVKLALNEDLVSQAKAMTDNFSELVESLLAEFVERETGIALQRPKPWTRR
jgi:antitoxin CcdA